MLLKPKNIAAIKPKVSNTYIAANYLVTLFNVLVATLLMLLII